MLDCPKTSKISPPQKKSIELQTNRYFAILPSVCLEYARGNAHRDLISSTPGSLDLCLLVQPVVRSKIGHHHLTNSQFLQVKKGNKWRLMAICSHLGFSLVIFGSVCRIGCQTSAYGGLVSNQQLPGTKAQQGQHNAGDDGTNQFNRGRKP